MFVSDLEVSVRFYVDVCGFHVLFREPGIGAVFLGNGSTHHDIALIEVTSRPLAGRDGQTQVSPSRGGKVGLNHLGFEMESEADLVAAYHRARARGVPLQRLADHQISHSVYLIDPEGNPLEFYADEVSDWRGTYSRLEGQLITGVWDPEAAEPASEARYDPDPLVAAVAGAQLQPVRAARAAFVVYNFEVMWRFYTEVAGLAAIMKDPAGDYGLLGTSANGLTFGLFKSGGEPAGLHHFGFELGDENEVDQGRERLRAAGVPLAGGTDTPTKSSVAVRDPDGFLLDFFFERGTSFEEPAAEPGGQLAWLV